MREYTHIASGIMLGVFLYNHPLPIALTVLGTVIPDMDSSFSKISSLTRNGKMRNNLLKHRGFLHTFTSAVIIYATYFLISGNNAILPFIFGYCLHIFLDSFTAAGVKPFAPFIKTKIRLGRGKIKTRSTQDKVLGIIFLCISITILVINFSKKF